MESVLGLILLVLFWQWAKAGYPGFGKEDARRPKRIPVAYRIDPAQRAAALEAYKHAISEKMDVMRLAIEKGWGDEELKRLDARLEELVGKDHLKRLLDGELPQQERGADSMDPVEEITRLRQPATRS